MVESYRTEVGPRQRIVMNLGKVDLKKSDWRRLAFVLEGKLSGQNSLINEPEINRAADAAMRNYDFYKIRKKNKVPGGKLERVRDEIAGLTGQGTAILGILPEDRVLSTLTIGELAEWAFELSGGVKFIISVSIGIILTILNERRFKKNDTKK